MGKGTGIRFEKEAIMAWIKEGNDRCPITGTRITSEDFVLDVELEDEIHRWRDIRLTGIKDRILNRRSQMMKRTSKVGTRESNLLLSRLDLGNRCVSARWESYTLIGDIPKNEKYQ